MKNRIFWGMPKDQRHDTEVCVVNELNNLPDSWAIAHNVLLPAAYRNNQPDETDIILIGPPGIYSLEVKWWSGTISGAWQDAWLNRTSHRTPISESWPNPIKIANNKKNILYSTLKKYLGRFPVMGGVIFPYSETCTFSISPPPYEINFPVLNLDDAVPFFIAEESKAGKRRGSRRFPFLDQHKVTRVFDFIRGYSDPIENDDRQTAGSYKLIRLEERTESYLSFFAQNLLIPSRFALVKKLIVPDFLPKSEYEETNLKLLREAEAASTLDGHPNVIQLFDAFTYSGDIFLAYEWITGPSLADWIQHAIDYEPEQLIREIMPLVMDVIRAAHTSQPRLIHRGLSPESILVLQDGTIKVVNFAHARVIGDEITKTRLWTDMEQSSRIVYTAPEALMSVNYTETIDIYSLGAICYAIGTGQAPPHPHSRVDDELDFNSGKYQIGQKIQIVIEKAMALAPGRRYQRVDEMTEDLQLALQ